MEVKDLEKRIKKLKAQIAEKKGSEGKAVEGLRETRKRLKRAQRRRKTLVTRAAYIEAKRQKKKQAGAPDVKEEGAKASPAPS